MSQSAGRAPVLIPAYRRPQQLDALLWTLAEHPPRRVYVSIDGPPPGDPVIAEAVQHCQAVGKKWQQRNPNVVLRVSERNLGCQKGVMAAVDWAFMTEDRLIILEDDIKPRPGFLEFCDDGLEYFRTHSGVGSLTGYSDVPTDILACPSSIRLSRFTSSWGWATWRDRWAELAPFIAGGIDVAPPEEAAGKSSKAFWRLIGYLVRVGLVDSWAYPWLFLHWKNDWWCVTPPASLTRNRGFGDSATHTGKLPSLPEVESGYMWRGMESGAFVSSNLDGAADAWSNKVHHKATLSNGVRVSLRALTKRMRAA